MGPLNLRLSDPAPPSAPTVSAAPGDGSSSLGWFLDDDPLDIMPEVGDSVGPYRLKRELGRGGFARVFLAEQTDLDDRLVVLKFSLRASREPWLLARSRHPNIVPILSTAEVNDGDLQMIAMPFLGGATLAAVFDRRADARSRPSPRARRRLLDDLDAVSAPEFPPAGGERPARRLLEAMTDERALAWIVARLAEALDHAWSRGVAHGDVKPSNILLTADAEPMLLDFNLARAVDDGRAGAFGGTPAYMAPERLAAAFEGEPRPEVDLHRADLYALALVLLEAITGWSPALDGLDGEAGNPADEEPPAARAARLARLRGEEHGGAKLVRRAEIASGRAIPPALRSILVHRLQPDPGARCDRGWKLAEDLDRWRALRPLVFAPEPPRRHVAARWARRNRRGLLAGLAGLAVLAATSALLIVGDWELGRRLEGEALGRLALIQDDPQSSLFDSQRPGAPIRRRAPADAAAAALRTLRAYRLVDDDAWRDQDAFRYLPPADRDDLELCLMEQALRYALNLSDLPAAPDDWRRAGAILDRAFGASDAWPAVALDLRRRLADRLDEPPPGRSSPSAPPWVEAYFDGVVAELDAEAHGPDAAAEGDGLDEALAHYNRLLELRPDSFWGRYRSAVIAFGRGQWAAAAADLTVCLKRRPDNPMLRAFMASCLLNQGEAEEALEQCNRALDAAPYRAEFFQTRAFIRASSESERLAGLEGDIHRYELLKRLLPPSYFQNPTAGDLADPAAGSVAASRRGLPLADHSAWRPRTGGSFADLIDLDPGELASRAALAAKVREAGLPPLALAELSKLLTLDPNNFAARIDRLCLILDQGADDNPFWLRQARDDLDRIFGDPRLADYVAGSPRRLDALHSACRKLAIHGLRPEALRLAAETLRASQTAGLPLGRSYYTLAQVQAIAARTSNRWTAAAADSLKRAISAHRDFETWFIQDHAFNPIRPQVRAILNASR